MQIRPILPIFNHKTNQMGATKNQFYSDELINMANLFKALGHPARLKAVVMIANDCEKDTSTDDIHQAIGLSRSTLSVHIKKLSDAGIIKTAVTTVNINKTKISFRLNKPAFEILLHFSKHLFSKAVAKDDEKKESFKRFYSTLRTTIGWDSFYIT